jgi:glycosyltransferase involved in cell wall biosynthesis
MLASAIGGIATRAHAPMIVWLQDVFPEVAQRFGIPGMSGLAARTFIRLRNTSLRNASQIVVIGESMRSIISQSVGREANSINVIHNWADGEAIVPIAHETNRLRAAWAEAGAFVVGYSGNLGRVHEFDTLLGAAQCLSPDTSVRFVIVGTGPRLQEVRLKVTQLGLKNISFHPLQPREELSLSLGVPDVHIAVLRPEFEGLVHPSKIYGIMAAGRPIIFVGDYRGEASKMIQAHDFGYAVECGNAAGLARAIQALKEAPDERRRMGLNARMSFEAHYDMPIALAQWEMLLQRTWDTR